MWDGIFINEMEEYIVISCRLQNMCLRESGIQFVRSDVITLQYSLQYNMYIKK